ncbi:hypothetical protein ABMA27_004770 [Loxostege sticticalis]|uniref:DDE-1 domain-containing protein n=1 Tax=Loxostege sticticalis TaxID=481309 RepID=A0ABR3HKL0_LOXSC
MAKTQKNKHKSRIRQRKSRRELGSRMYKNYSDEMLKIACEAVESKQISSRDAERQFGIPRRTIVNKIKNKHMKSVGHPTILTIEEEHKIVRVLQASSNFGSPLTKVDLKLLVHEYLKKNSRQDKFKNQIPGDAWVQGFLARHAEELTVRTTQNISKARAEKGSQEIIDYFENLKSTLKDVPSENIINFDETNLSDDPGSSKCIFRRGVKYPERIANSTKGNISIMFTATANGKCLPVYVVYKASTLYSEWIDGGPTDARYNCTKSGWFDSAMFENYFENIIIPWAQKTVGAKVVICDNLSSHLSVKVIELCEQNDIKFIFIPPRSTHLTQPLDVAFFAPLKKAWRKILYQYKLKNPNQTTLNKKHFPKLLRELLETIKLKEMDNIKSGFKASGVYPVNPHEVLKKIPEIQEDILSYGIDQALLDYLKETRAPKPMQTRRNKKINCEPGKSVTVSDLNIDFFKDTNKNARKAKNNSSGVAKKQRKNDDHLLTLDEKTGLFTKTNLNPPNNDICEALNCNLEEFDIARHENYTPESLCQCCINIINCYLCPPVRSERSSSISPKFFTLKAGTSSETSMAQKTDQHFVNDGPSKITILSNVLIKTGTPTSNVRSLKEVSNTIENTPFSATHKNDLPESLQEKKIKELKKVPKKESSRKRKMNNKEKGKKYSKGKKSISVKRRQNISDSESSSVSADIEMITADDSDYETINDYYIAECLREQEEKENFESLDTSFGLHDIEYFTENSEKIKKDDWIVARFATKKSLKHFVGNVLSINNGNPTVKFARKVKQTKCEKGTTFTYPRVDDICTMKHLEDIITILPRPNITRRGQIVFNVDFSHFNIQ